MPTSLRGAFRHDRNSDSIFHHPRDRVEAAKAQTQLQSATRTRGMMVQRRLECTAFDDTDEIAIQALAKRDVAFPVELVLARGNQNPSILSKGKGLEAPANLPTPVRDRLHAELTTVLAEPAIVDTLKKLGNLPITSTPDEFKARLVSEIDTWTKVVGIANIERI